MDIIRRYVALDTAMNYQGCRDGSSWTRRTLTSRYTGIENYASGDTPTIQTADLIYSYVRVTKLEHRLDDADMCIRTEEDTTSTNHMWATGNRAQREFMHIPS